MAKLPNYLTYGRIAAIPVIMLLLLSRIPPPCAGWRLILYIAAAVTDYFDGYLARKYGTVSANRPHARSDRRQAFGRRAADRLLL